MRIGTSLDVHAFCEDEMESNLKLGCIEFENTPRLVGHSDGDVVAHALGEAILLAAELGDLGQVIGVDLKETAGISGENILKICLEKAFEKGFKVENATVQIVAARPQITPKNHLMREKLSDIVKAPVSVGSTTTDHQIAELGNGKAVMAIATVLLK